MLNLDKWPTGMPSSLMQALLGSHFRCHSPLKLSCFVTYTPENGRGCSYCLQRSSPYPGGRALCPQAQTPSPPSVPGTAARLSVATPRWHKTPRSASGNWERRPPRRSRWSSRRGHAGAFADCEPRPEPAALGWCSATSVWHGMGQRALMIGTQNSPIK